MSKYYCDTTHYLIHPEDMHQYLTFDVDKLIIKEHSIEMINTTAEDFLKLFDAIIFTKKDGTQVKFKKEEGGDVT